MARDASRGKRIKSAVFKYRRDSFKESLLIKSLTIPSINNDEFSTVILSETTYFLVLD